MKKIKIMLAVVAMLLATGVYAQKQALLVSYSQTDNVYEDEYIKAELVRLSLKITNKTNKPLFVDRSSSFYYINDEAICLDEKHDDNVNHMSFQPLAPKSDTWVSTLINPIRGKYDAGGGRGKAGGKANYQSDLRLQVMNYMETMRYELANNQKKSCTSIHLTGDESFMKVKVYIKYDVTNRRSSTDEKESEQHTFTISTWDKSPIDMYLTQFDKGKFTIYRLGASDAEKEGKQEKSGAAGAAAGKGRDKKNEESEIKSNFEERNKTRQVLIWEGETTNWVQALQDSYESYLIEDGMKPKKARDEAKDKAKKEKVAQTLKP